MSTTALLSREQFEEAVGAPLHEFGGRCHEASLALVKSGVLGENVRVARGTCAGVGSQHSWVVYGDPYEPTATIVDPTLWSYDETVNGIYVGFQNERPHIPHGSGSIWDYGRPAHHGGETITLDAEFSDPARVFLTLLGPLDRKGWAQLAHAPVGGWPAAQIIGAMYDDERISALVPIDVVGMVTDRNPHGLYLP